MFWSAPALASDVLLSIVIETVSFEGVQVPLVIVHSKTFAPIDKPVTADVGDDTVVTIAPPEITAQFPDPNIGELAAKVAIVVLHKVWSFPAFAIVGRGSTIMVTESTLGVQVPFVIVQVKVFTPVFNPVTPELGSIGFVIVAVPAVIVQSPAPRVGALAAKIAVVAQIF